MYASNKNANTVLELETSRARLQVEKEQLQNEVREVERRKGFPHMTC
jgi:hypothetical protein